MLRGVQCAERTIVTRVGAVSVLCDTFSARLPYPRRSNNCSSELKAGAEDSALSEPEAVFSRAHAPQRPPAWGATQLFKPRYWEQGVGLTIRIHFCFQPRETTDAEIRVL